MREESSRTQLVLTERGAISVLNVFKASITFSPSKSSRNFCCNIIKHASLTLVSSAKPILCKEAKLSSQHPSRICWMKRVTLDE
ncbi:hypothetical protein Hanom_Chr16g01504721 [Helianthus anomalus]